MSFLSKVELKKQLQEIGIKVVEGNYVRKSDIKNAITANVYYVTVDHKDFEYNQTYDAAKNSALNALKKFPKGEILIEVYTGKKHGGGGDLVKTMKLNNKTKQFEKIKDQ